MNRLSVRLSLAFLLTAWLGIGAMVIVVQRTLETGFRQYLSSRDNQVNPEQVARLEAYFAANGTWVNAESVLSGRGGGGNGSNQGAVILVTDLDGQVVAATDSNRIGTTFSLDVLASATALMVEDTQVGWLFRESPGLQALGEAEQAFLNEANRWFTLAGIGSTALALAVGALLAWSLVRPLRDLTHAVQDLSIGQLGRQVETRGTIEVQALAVAFNRLSTALAEVEALRQRMAAAVAHELRTPVSILRGHLEAILDGLYPADSAHIATAYDQTLHLAHLVEDLRVLTLAEAKQLPLEFARLQPATLVNQVLDSFEPLTLDSDIRLSRHLVEPLPDVRADSTRIRQVLTNLMTNALRHTPAGGSISVQVLKLPSGVRFCVENTGSSLNAIELERVFQPFWRAESARERDSGGSGLGLAISREIIRLHGGVIEAESLVQGVCFSFTLPAQAAESLTKRGGS